MPFTERDPLVTVCIPTYPNYVQLLERSIPSVLAQDYQNIEVVVVGDAAPPETAAAHQRSWMTRGCATRTWRCGARIRMIHVGDGWLPAPVRSTARSSSLAGRGSP